ncbi:hypothetical protein [Streptomyces sp. NPDC002851]
MPATNTRYDDALRHTIDDALHQALIVEQYGRPLEALLQEKTRHPLPELLKEQRRRPSLPGPSARPLIPGNPDPDAAAHRVALEEAIALRPHRKAAA